MIRKKSRKALKVRRLNARSEKLTSNGADNTGVDSVDPLLTQEQAARRLTLKNPKTLTVWRCTRRYDIPFVRIGRYIRYRQSSIDSFLASLAENSLGKTKTK